MFWISLINEILKLPKINGLIYMNKMFVYIKSVYVLLT